MKILQHLERAMFGATAEEAAEMRMKLIDRRIDQRLDRLVAALEQDEDEPVDHCEAIGDCSECDGHAGQCTCTCHATA